MQNADPFFVCASCQTDSKQLCCLPRVQYLVPGTSTCYAYLETSVVVDGSVFRVGACICWIMFCSSFFFGSCGPQAAARLSSRIYYYVVRSTYAPAVVVSVWERILHCQTARGWWITRMWWWCTGWAGRSHISRTFRSASNVALWLWWWCGAISAGATAILAKLEEFSNWWKSQVLSNFY